MNADFEPWNYEAVLRAFRVLTGIELRVVPNEVAKQAVLVAENFSLRDMELVVLWTQKQIARGQNGFSSASLQWRVIMGRIGCGEDLMAFQDRLGTATKEMARGWKPGFKLCAEAVPEPCKATAGASEYERLRLESQRRADAKMQGGPQT